jgi:hypothetical protein
VAGELLCRAAGGLVGLGPAAGAVLVAGLCTASWWFARQRALSAVDRGLVVAGWCGAVVAVAAIARARAGLPDLDFYDSNRYLFPVAVPLALVVAPVLRAAVSAVVSWRAQVPSRRPAAGGAWTVVAALLLAGAVAGQRVEARWATDFTAANDAVRAAVQSTSATLVACCPDGCPGGSPLPPDARPAGRWSPQVTVALVEELLRRGLLPSGPVGPDTMGAVSRAGGGGGACAGGG